MEPHRPNASPTCCPCPFPRSHPQKPLRDKVPNYWSYVLKNSGVLNRLQSTPSDANVLTFLTDISFSHFSYVVSNDQDIPGRKRLFVTCQLNFDFDENPLFVERRLWKRATFVMYQTSFNTKMLKSR